MTKIETIAAFDFDGTITYRDTLLPFFRYVTGLPKTCFKLAIQSPTLIGFATGKYTRQDVKEKFLTRFFKEMSAEELREKGEAYAKGPLMDKLKPEAVQRLRWHQEKGHRCILVSANLDVYLEPWHRLMGFDELICSQLEVVDGRMTGKLVGNNCWGPEKEVRVRKQVGTGHLLYAYGDSRGDAELLEMADFPFFGTFK